jgi:transcriptional regulator GlxA family with amidase domain
MARTPLTPTATHGGLAPWQIQLALRWLLRDLCADFPVGDLAKLCGLSRSYFTRAFKVSMGLPPHRLLMRHRIQCAQEMLERTAESISSIAGCCGFSDQSHLTRIFHARVGFSPAAWRRQRKAAGRGPGGSPGTERSERTSTGKY